MTGAGFPVPLRMALAFTGLAVIALVICAYTHCPYGLYLKMAAATGFVASGIAAGGLRSGYGRMILAGLACSWWGDLFLALSGESYFLMGLVAFLGAHVAYSIAFLVHGVCTHWAAFGLGFMLIPAVPLTLWLYPNLGGMRIPVVVYMVVITLMVALSIGAQGRQLNIAMLAGAVLFYLSDICVARQRFVDASIWNALIGLPLYFVAQMLFATSISKFVREDLDSNAETQ